MSEYGTFSWDYYYLRNGKLVDKNGIVQINIEKEFATVDEAEQWLIDNNERGNVIGFYEDLPKKRRKEKS